MLCPKAHKMIMFIMFATNSNGTIMEIRSTRSLNAIPATLISVVSTCTYQICCVNCIAYISFIYSFIYLFILLCLPLLILFYFVANFYLPTTNLLTLFEPGRYRGTLTSQITLVSKMYLMSMRPRKTFVF